MHLVRVSLFFCVFVQLPRRLVKSNRPLYRACPKHTKLLVSKAIVQAVEQQGGRFLDRNQNDGSWFEVSYKRAVDKTSQGLRERERDGEQQQDSNNKKGGIDSSGDAPPPPMMRVPEQFSGRVKAPNLADLADVAIAHATQGTNSSSSNNKGPSTRNTAGSTAAAVPPAAAPRAAAPALNFGGNNLAASLKDTTAPPLKKRLMASQTPAYSSQQPQQQQQTKRFKPNGEEEEELVPLPPSLDQRESSMFRLLKQTRLLLEQSENWGLGGIPAALEPRPLPNGVDNMTRKYPTKLNNLNGGVAKQNGWRGTSGRELIGLAQQPPMQRQEQEAVQQQMQQQQQQQIQLQQQQRLQQQLLQQQQQFSAAEQKQGLLQLNDVNQLSQPSGAGIYGSLTPSPYALSTSLPDQNLYSSGGLQSALPGASNTSTASSFPPNPAPAPPPVLPLTRLTSQMSDWLTSFWPVPASARTETAPPAPEPVGTLGGGGSAMPSGGQNNSILTGNVASAPAKMTRPTISAFQRDVAPKIINVPPPRIDPVQITTIPPMKVGANDPSDNGGAAASMDSLRPNGDGGSMVPTMQNGSQPFRVAGPQEKAGLSSSAQDMETLPAPTELEQSVSATLLKLAGSPAKLYSGLTSFFGGSSESDPAEPKLDTVPPPPSVGMQPRSNTLDGIPPPPPGPTSSTTTASTMVGTKRSSTSLLDDHEETPMEQRVRGATWKSPSGMM